MDSLLNVSRRSLVKWGLVSAGLPAFSGLLGPALRAQDAATQERLDKLSGRIEDLTAAQESIKQQLNGLTRELADMREQLAKPTANYARPEDLNRLGEAIKDVDRKRMEDADKVHAELLKLRDLLKAPLTSPKQKAVPQPRENTASEAPPADVGPPFALAK